MDTPKLNIARSNSAAFDAIFTDSQGRRVYFHEDGRPYVFDTRGRRITRFKGADQWKPFVDNIHTNFRPKSNMMTYEIKGLDNEGNVIKTLTYNTELFDIMDYKARRLADNVEKDIRNHAFDYVLAKKILQAHNEFNEEGISVRGLQIDTFVDGTQVSRHLSESGQVIPTNMMKPQHYIMPTVFNPLKINWSAWSLPDILSNESLARQHRSGDGADYLSLRGLGLQNPNEIDTEAVKRLFGADYGVYQLFEGEDHNRLRFGNGPVMAYPTNAAGVNYTEQISFQEKKYKVDEAGETMMTLDEQKQAALAYQQRKEEFIKRSTKIARDKAIAEGKDPDAPTVYEAYGMSRAYKNAEEATRRRFEIQHNPTNDPGIAAVHENLKEYERIFVDSGYGKGIETEHLLRFDDSKLFELYDDEKPIGGVNFYISDEELAHLPVEEVEKEKRRLTQQRLAQLEVENPELHNILLTSKVTDEDGNFVGYKLAQPYSITHDNRTDAQKASDAAYERARLELERKLAPKDTDAYNLRRTAVTRDIQEYYDGYEAYQKADRVFTANDINTALQDGVVQREVGKGYYMDTEAGRSYLQQTYNYQGEQVWALLRSGSLDKNLDQNVHEFFDEEANQRLAYDAVTLNELEHDKIRLNSEQEKSLFVLTDIGRQKMEEAQKTAVKVRQHNEIIDELFQVVKEARDEGRQEKIKLTENLQRIFGLETPEINSTQAFVATSRYFSQAYQEGLTNITLSDADIRGGRAFDNLRGYLYQAKAERHGVWDEMKRWGDVRKAVREERNGLLREFNVLTDDRDGMASDLATSREIQDSYEQRLHLDELHKETTKYRDILDENDEALKRIASGIEETENTGKRAKREIMDSIIQSRADATIYDQSKRQAMQAMIDNAVIGKPITRSMFHGIRKGTLEEEEAMRAGAGEPVNASPRPESNVPEDLQNQSGKGTQVSNTGDSLSREESNRLYNMILDDINRDRSAMGLPSLRALDVQSIQNVLTTPTEIKNWKETQERLQNNGALYRRKGDYSLYSINKVLEDGTVIGERLSLPASAFNLELTFTNPDVTRTRSEVAEELEKTTNALIPEDEKISGYQLSEEQLRELESDRTTHITQEAGNKQYRRILSNYSLGEMLLSRGQYERFQSDTGKANIFVNKRLMDITASRAGWMLRKDNREDVASNIAMAFYETLNEKDAIKLSSKNGVVTFDQEFEDAFTKNLHRAYFEMSQPDGPKRDAVDSLVRDVARFASEYVENDPTLTAEENKARLVSEVHRLLTDKTGTTITQKYGYYEESLDPTRISSILGSNPDDIAPVTSLEQLHYVKDRENNEYGDSADDLHTERATELTEQELIDDQIRDNRRTAEKVASEAADENLTGFVSDGQVRHHYYAMDAIRKGVDDVLQGKDEDPGIERKLRRDLGEEYVDRLIESRGTGRGYSDWDLFRQYYDNTLLPEYGGDGAYQVIQSLNKYVPEKGAKPVMNEGFWQGIHKEILTPNLSTPDRVRSYVELIDTMPSIQAKFTIDKNELLRLMPERTVEGALHGLHEYSDMLPENDTFHVFVGNKGDLMARSNMTNHIFQITGTKANGEVDRPVVAWNAYSEEPSREGFVARRPTLDATHVASPADTLPIAVNNPYNANRINRSPSGVGFLSSSDVATRSGLERILSGQKAVGFDFETTGFVDSQFLNERGIVLPTEAFYRQGQMQDGQFTLGEGRHVFLDVGAQTDKNGISVRDIVSKELGTMKSGDVIGEVLGSDAKRWDMLSEQDQLKVMKSDKVAFLRNLAKYSNQLSEGEMANVTNFNYRPSSFMNEYKNLVKHAQVGLDNLSQGTVKPGATYVKTLDEFMDIYRQETAGNVLVAQNGADADLRWANHFAQMTGTQIDRPQMVEMMHLSRFLHPSEGSHSLQSQISRSSIPGLLQQYQQGSHLADVDTDSMMRLFGEEYLPQAQAKGLQEIDWLKPGQHIVRLGSTGSNKIPHNVYTVQTQTKDALRGEDGSYQLALRNLDGIEEVISAPSLQELQRNISKNYKAFGSEEDALKFLNDLTFDDAREDVSGATLSYNNMVRERSRAEGNGTDVAMEKLRGRYDRIQSAIADGSIIPDELSNADKKILANGHVVSDSRIAQYQSPEYSDRQRRAMMATEGFFKSEDAELRQQFLGEVENLQSAGVISHSDGRDLIAQYNEKIKARAREIGRGPLEKEVPGLVDLGRVQGEQFTGLQGRRFTTLANTYEQAERGLWEVANQFKDITSKQAQQAGTWRGEAVNLLTQHLKQTGIMPETAGNRMEDAVDAVLTHLQNNGNMKVEDITTPLIRTTDADGNPFDDTEMRQIFQDVHNEVLAGPMEQVAARPDLRSNYEATKAVRDEIESRGMAAYGFNFRTAGDYQGEYLPTEGDFAYRHADDIFEEIQALRSMTDQTQVEGRVNDLWNEIYRRATHEGNWNDATGEIMHYSDRDAAISHLGWDSTPNNYVHPSQTKHYPAGTRYADMESIHIENIQKFTPRDEIRDRATEYLNNAFGQNGVTPTFTHINPSQRLNMESIVDVITAEPEPTNLERVDRFIDEPEWDRPLAGNRPDSELQHMMRGARERATDIRHQMAELMPSKGVMGLIAAGAGAAYLVSQWTRGDSVTPESRPQLNEAPDTSGNYQQPAPQGPPPAPQPNMGGGKTYLQPNEGVSVNIQAKNRNGVSQEQMDAAIQQAMGNSGASVTVQHHDDTSSINNEWLREKFSQLLDNGFVN